MRVVANHVKCATAADDQYVGTLALAFCDSLPSDFKGSGKVKGALAAFRSDLQKGIKALDVAPISSKFNLVDKVKSANNAAWGVLSSEGSKVEMPTSSRYFSDDIEYQSFLLVKAFVDGFRSLLTRVPGNIPKPAKLDTLWNVTRTDAPVGAARRAFELARSKFDSLEKVPDEKVVEPGEKGKPVEPITKDVQKTLKELGGSPELYKNLSKDKKDKLRGLVDEIQEVMTAPEPALARSASLDDALSRLVRFIRPVLRPFLDDLREEHVPAPARDERVWNDPTRLREMLENMDPEQMKAVLKQTEKILGMLAYSD